MEQIYHIFDKIFKRIFSLSNLAIINLINGLFGTNYPLDSEVSYPNKEFVNRAMKRRFADLFITIGENHSYHLEAQVKNDEVIVIRVFEYSFLYAMLNRTEDRELYFPDPCVIYLSDRSDIPEEEFLTIRFGTQGTMQYKVKNYIYLKHDVTELNQKRMIVLIPFQLLKLRRMIQQNPSQDNFECLKKLIQDDILGSIKANLKVGNITQDDANQLVELTRELYDQIYQHYEKLGGVCEEMKPLLHGAMELPLDKYRIRIEQLEKSMEKIEEKNQEIEEEKQKIEKQNQKMEKENQRLKEENDLAGQTEKKLLEEISRLKAMLEQQQK